MNYPARVFRDLSSTWQQDAANERIDILAAELTSCVAVGGTLCLGVIHTEAVPKFFGLVYLLDGYGILLRKRHRKEGGVLVFAEIKQAIESEFVGAAVYERTLERPETLSTKEAEFAYAA